MADVVVRPSIESADIPALRQAYAAMQQLPVSDNRGWTFWAGYHGFPSWQCWHHSRVGQGQSALAVDLFLPWHRAYLHYFDHASRDHAAGRSCRGGTGRRPKPRRWECRRTTPTRRPTARSTR